LDLALDGISSVGCLWMIETIFASYPDSVCAYAHPPSDLLHQEWLPGKCDIATLLEKIMQFGYVAATRNQHSGQANSKN